MNWTGDEIETTEPAPSNYRDTLTSWRMIPLSAVFISVLDVPVGLTYYFVELGSPRPAPNCSRLDYTTRVIIDMIRCKSRTQRNQA